MRVLVGILGLLLLLSTLWDAFETIILPRRVRRSFRMARLFYRVTWTSWSGIARCIRAGKFRESYLSYFGPLSLLILFAVWGFALIVGFAMLQWAAGSAVTAVGMPRSFETDLYFSGSSFLPWA